MSISISNTSVTESSTNESQTNVNAVGTENSPSKASSTSSSPRRTATNSTKSNSPSVNKNTRVENSKEIIYKMDKNGIQSNGSPMTNKKFSRSSVYPSGTNLTARDAFGRIPINYFSFSFYVFCDFFLSLPDIKEGKGKELSI